MANVHGCTAFHSLTVQVSRALQSAFKHAACSQGVPQSLLNILQGLLGPLCALSLRSWGSGYQSDQIQVNAKRDCSLLKKRCPLMQAELVAQFLCCIPLAAVDAFLSWLRPIVPDQEQEQLRTQVSTLGPRNMLD